MWLPSPSPSPHVVSPGTGHDVIILVQLVPLVSFGQDMMSQLASLDHLLGQLVPLISFGTGL